MKRKLKVLSAFISMGLILIGIMITYSIKAEWKQDAYRIVVQMNI